MGGGSPYNGLYGEAPPERGTFFRLEVYIKGKEFYELKYRKGLGKLTFKYYKGLSKYLEQTLLTAKSSKCLRAFSNEKFSITRSVGIYERDKILYLRYTKGYLFSQKWYMKG